MRSRPKRRTTIGGQFAWRLIEMLESPAYQVLSQSSHRILARLEIEIAHHGGKDNGRLPVTFENFQNYCIDRHAIAPAIRECEALGFVEITERGRAGNAEFRSSNKFRLTYRETAQAGPTDDWRRVKTIEDARNLAYVAKRSASKKQKPNGGKRHLSVGKPHPENGGVPVGEVLTSAIPEKPPRLSISAVGTYTTGQGGSRSAPAGSAVASEPLRELIETIVKLHGCSRAEAAIILESLPDAEPHSIE
jgi:hypothetical protein